MLCISSSLQRHLDLAFKPYPITCQTIALYYVVRKNSSWTLCAGTYAAAQCSTYSSSSNAAGTNSWYMNKEDVMCLKVVKIDSCGSHTTHITDIYWLLAVRENFQTKWGWCKHRSVNDRKMANMRDQTKAICKILWIFIWGLDYTLYWLK